MADRQATGGSTSHCGSAAAWVALAMLLAGCGTARDDLASFGDSLVPLSARQAARLMVDPHDPENRRLGTVAIANAPFGGSDAYLALYRDAARHEPDPLVKAISISALGRHGAPQDAPLIARSLTDSQFQVRWEASKALQRIHNPAVVPDLLRALRQDDESPNVRVAAATALGQYPQDRVFQGLIAALDAPELAVNVAAHRSLTILTGQDRGLDSRPWLEWYNAADEPFAGQQEYLYPTYTRPETWLEKLAFWSGRRFEQPGTPAGLGSASRRTTYQVEEEASADETGG